MGAQWCRCSTLLVTAVLFGLLVAFIFPTVSPVRRVASLSASLGLSASDNSSSFWRLEVVPTCGADGCNNIVIPQDSRAPQPFCSCSCPPEYCGFFCEQPCSNITASSNQSRWSAAAAPSVRGNGKHRVLVMTAVNYGQHDAAPIRENLKVEIIPYMASTFYSADNVDGEVVKGGVLIACDGPVQEAVTIDTRDKIVHSFPHVFPNPAAMPGWIADWERRARNHNRLTSHNLNSDWTWVLEQRRSTTTRVFCVFSARILGVGHYFHDIMTVLGKFFYLYGNQSQEYTLIMLDPQHCPGRLCGELVYWPLHFLNVSVVFMPREAVLRVDEASFVKAEETPTPWSVAFLRDIIWPRVARKYAGYPIYKRIAFIKAVGSGVVSPRSGFKITPKFLALLESNGFILIDTATTPVPERMWYINHAEHVFITWGTLGDTMLALRVQNVTQMSVKVLYHTGYLDEMGLAKRLMKQKKLIVNVRARGNRTWVMDMTRAVDHISRNSVVYFNSVRMVKIGNNDLDELESRDLFGAPGPG